MSFVPPDFGGLIATWDPRKPHALIVRYGKGRPQEGLHLTPLNLLQLHKTVQGLITEGKQRGFITEEHVRQSEQLPAKATSAKGIADAVTPRDQVDKIAGPD